MQLVVDTKSFADAVSWVAKTLDTKDDKSYIALVVNADGDGYLSHTNGLSYIESPLQIDKIELEDDETEVKLALGAQYTKRLASTLRDHSAPLTFSKDLNNPRTSLTVKRPQENYTIPLVEARIGAAPKYEVIGSVSDGEYFDTLNRLAKLTDPANAGVLPVIGTVDVRLDPDEKTITVMATDRYALGEIVIPFVPSTAAEFFGENKNLLIPEERASMIAPSKGSVDNIELIFEGKSSKFGYTFPDGRIALFALSTAEPLAYGVIKKSASGTEGKALISITELRNAIASISSLVYDETNIQLTITSKGLIISDIHETNTLRVTLADTTEIEEPIVVRFSRSILNEALGPISTNRFNLKWKDEKSAFILEPVFDDDTVADNVFLLAIPERA
jgi:DNA polymerase III sliding clamp (beta) subunit (PCNA family)